MTDHVVLSINGSVVYDNAAQAPVEPPPVIPPVVTPPPVTPPGIPPFVPNLTTSQQGDLHRVDNFEFNAGPKGFAFAFNITPENTPNRKFRWVKQSGDHTPGNMTVSLYDANKVGIATMKASGQFVWPLGSVGVGSYIAQFTGVAAPYGLILVIEP